MLKYFKYLLYMVIPIVIGIIFLTVLDYLGLFNSNILKVFKIILILSSTFVLYYSIILITSIFGSTVGINLKRNN